MSKFDRRTLLRYGSAGLLGGAASGMLGGQLRAISNLAASARANAGMPPTFDEKLLVVFQRGGQDSLNMVSPSGVKASGAPADPVYAAQRPDLQITNGLSLANGPGANNFARLHPSMATFLPVFDNGNVAFVHRLGYENHSRSHFESMQNIETTYHYQPDETRGVLNRFGQLKGYDQPPLNPLGGTSVSGAMQTLFAGSPALVQMDSIESFKLDPSGGSADYAKLIDAGGIGGGNHLANTYGNGPNGNKWDEDVRNSAAVMAEALTETATLGPYASPANWTTYPWPSTGGEANSEGLPTDGNALAFIRRTRDAVQLLRETPCQVAGVEIGGWDTHNQQLPQHAGLLKLLSHVLRSVEDDTTKDTTTGRKFWQRLVVVVMTEFGRTTNQNGTLGTDHGNAGCWIVAGGPVNGGVYNCDESTWVTNYSQPSPLLDEPFAYPGVNVRYLSYTIDYRNLLPEVFRFLGVQQSDMDQLIDGYSANTMLGPAFELGIL